MKLNKGMKHQEILVYSHNRFNNKMMIKVDNLKKMCFKLNKIQNRQNNDNHFKISNYNFINID